MGKICKIKGMSTMSSNKIGFIRSYALDILMEYYFGGDEASFFDFRTMQHLGINMDQHMMNKMIRLSSFWGGTTSKFKYDTDVNNLSYLYERQPKTQVLPDHYLTNSMSPNYIIKLTNKQLGVLLCRYGFIYINELFGVFDEVLPDGIVNAKELYEESEIWPVTLD